MMGWSQPSLSEFAAAVLAQPETGPWFGEGLATRLAGDVLLGGASGADSLLLNTKASQEAACSRAPAAIVPGQKPESRDTGVSLFAENGSHLARADGADAVARHDGNPGSSGFHETGSHLAEADAAEGLAGGVPPGVNERTGRTLGLREGQGTRGTFRQKKPPTIHGNMSGKNGISTDKTVFLSLLAGETRLCPDKSPMLRRANAHQLPVGRGHCLTKARCSLCRRGAQRVGVAGGR